MTSWAVNSFDAHTPVNGDTNINQDTLMSPRNSFLPAGFVQHFSPDNSESTVNRYSEDNPLWQEVTKRYQEIIEREYKLLKTFPVYHEGQVTPLTNPVSVAGNSPSTPKIGISNKEQHHEKVGEKGLPPRKTTEEQSNARDAIVIEDHIDSTVAEEIEDESLPKIVEVYSINNPKIQGEETVNRKRKKKQDVSSHINEDTSRDVTQTGDSPTSALSWKKPYVVTDNFIDLTAEEEEEETTACSSDDKDVGGSNLRLTVKVNENCQSGLEQPKEDTAEKGITPQSRKCNRRKRKGVFINKREGKNSMSTRQQKGNTSKKESNADCDKSDATNNNNNDRNNSSSNNKNNDNNNNSDHSNNKYDSSNKYQNLTDKEALNDQNNNDRNKLVKKASDERNRNLIRGNVNNGNVCSLDMSYRENKITDLKMRLARQEEELAKLRTSKVSKAAIVQNLQAPFKFTSVENLERKESTRIELENQKREATPETVNIENICQHVLKSFDIFNARKREGKTSIEGLNGLHESKNDAKNTNHSSVNGVGGCSLHSSFNEQDQFLFQVGLPILLSLPIGAYRLLNRSFVYAAVRVWNNLPEDIDGGIEDSGTSQAFKRRAQKQLLNSRIE